MVNTRVDELQKQIDALNYQGEELRAKILALKKERDTIIDGDKVKAQFDALTDKEKAAMAQHIKLFGVAVDGGTAGL